MPAFAFWSQTIHEISASMQSSSRDWSSALLNFLPEYSASVQPGHGL
jgi:hypothetical protein